MNFCGRFAVLIGWFAIVVGGFCTPVALPGGAGQAFARDSARQISAVQAGVGQGRPQARKVRISRKKQSLIVEPPSGERKATAGSLVGAMRLGGPSTPSTAENVRLSGDRLTTRFQIGLSKGVTVEVFTLANPYRVVIDMPDVRFRLPQGRGQRGHGLIKAFRYGLFSKGKARVVIDTILPVRITRAEMIRVKSVRGGVNLILELMPTDPKIFGQGTGANRKPTKRPQKEAVKPASKPRKKTPKTKPLVMIDPGHGGIDPGALGASRIYEKVVVLSVAKRLRDALRATGKYRVALTRRSDVFVSLDRRLQISKDKGADLFISLHADAFAQKHLVNSVRGATVYTLSEQASDEQARRAAEKENSSDLVAGLQTEEAEGSNQVRDILLDLIKRETKNFSADFARVLVGQLRRTINMRKTPRRSAAFKVLKQAHAPSVLIELGYLSNPSDEGLLRSPSWQKKVAKSITRAVDIFFTKNR